MGLKFCFIGAGNLATHLAMALHSKVGEVVQVYSRSLSSAEALAQQIDADSTNSTSEIVTDANIYFVALKDAVLHEVLRKIDFQNKLLVHCSGSLPLSVLDAYSENTGVLYPLQTFSKSREVDFSKIPVFIEANNKDNRNTLTLIAEKISGKVTVLDSAKRKSLHIAAVFACNFVNHFYTLAANYLADQEIPYEVLHPLIEETANKAIEMHPKQAQTGPAIRFDENIINDHLESLTDYAELKELYNSISRSIFELHQTKE